MPYSVVLMLSLAVYLMGHQTAKPAPRIAVAEKSAVILEAALNEPSASQEKLKQQVAVPIRAVIERYEKAGFVVVNTSRNDQGDITLDALPADTIDITNELRAAVHLPVQKPAVASPIPAPAAAGPSIAGTRQ
ncbi:hypothetical protein [Paraburkholderia kururiensis]|uniref:hypothetical protein n=1 Tax=Paraburkholderia kururiensis TaxID=984307 RepID=UPI0039A451AC